MYINWYWKYLYFNVCIIINGHVSWDMISKWNRCAAIKQHVCAMQWTEAVSSFQTQFQKFCVGLIDQCQESATISLPKIIPFNGTRNIFIIDNIHHCKLRCPKHVVLKFAAKRWFSWPNFQEWSTTLLSSTLQNENSFWAWIMILSLIIVGTSQLANWLIMTAWSKAAYTPELATEMSLGNVFPLLTLDDTYFADAQKKTCRVLFLTSNTKFAFLKVQG